MGIYFVSLGTIPRHAMHVKRPPGFRAVAFRCCVAYNSCKRAPCHTLRCAGEMDPAEEAGIGMARVRKISRHPLKTKRNYFIVDACFLAEKYVPVGTAPTSGARDNVRKSKQWWREIDGQLGDERARVYIPDLCIAEAFKVLAKKYYREDAFSSPTKYKQARDRLSADVSMTHRQLQAQQRNVKYHDVPASRDIIVSTGRFYELFMKHKINVGLIDLILVSTAKYLMDFHDAERSQLHIITMDKALWRGTKKVTELPNAYDPTEPLDRFDRVFR